MVGVIGATVTVLRPVGTGVDAFGRAVVDWAAEEVGGVLIAPGSTSGAGAERPDGVRSTIKLHIPKAYTASLRGCRVEALGRAWDVVGDPMPMPGGLCPGPWDREVEAVAAYG